MKRKIIGIFGCMLLISTGVVPVLGELIPFKKTADNTNPTDSGDSTLKFMVAGKAIRALRSYWLHVPPSYDGSKPVPLVIVLHYGDAFGYAERLGLAGTDPGFLAPSADLSSASEGCLLVVAGTPYTIRGIEPDARTGITLLQLETYPANGFDRGFDAGFGD